MPTATENKKPYDVLVADTAPEIENLIKACIDKGKFELVGPVCFAGGKFTATVKNTKYKPPAPDNS